MTTTEKMVDYINNKCINLTELSKKTHIPYSLIYDTVRGRKETNMPRLFRADEFMKICCFLGLNPMDFANDEEENEVENE